MVGPTLVLFGIIWELVLLIRRLPEDVSLKVKDSHHIKEICAVFIVVIGVTIELIVVPHVLLEVAGLKERTEALRAKNDALELEIAPRTITKIQETNFIWLSKFIQKIPITVRVVPPRNENLTYAVKLRELLSKAGFGTNSGANEFGVVEDNSVSPYRKKPGNGWMIVCATSNTALSNHFGGTPIIFTNGFSMPITTNNDEQSVYLAIGDVFKQIDIPTDFSSDFPSLPPGEWQIIVSPRDY